MGTSSYLCYPFRMVILALLMALHWKSVIITACRICTQNIRPSLPIKCVPSSLSCCLSPSKRSYRISTSDEVSGILSASSKLDDDERRHSSWRSWSVESSVDRPNCKRSPPPIFVLFYEQSSEDRFSNFNDDDDVISNNFISNVTSSNESENLMSSAMIATIGFYKKIISPLLPPACRFVPTCSSYGVQAIQEFGTTKGCVLIAWRILRCSPFGGKGYDPPKWPPVSYTYSSY